MTENPKMETMFSHNLRANCEAGELSDHVNGLQSTTIKSDSFVLDIERLEKDINANSRIKVSFFFLNLIISGIMPLFLPCTLAFFLFRFPKTNYLCAIKKKKLLFLFMCALLDDKLQRSISRKGTFRGVEKKNTANEKDISVIETSTRAALLGGGTPEKPLIVAMGGCDNFTNPPVHNQITIMGNPAVESKFGGKIFSFGRSSPSWTIDPRRILLFFATL
ncbi:Hypothetical predicted protein [Olea europaea subsp. europaea]|uniref:Uncharacterized protein n=1 Tax=Olea europaea subsp. europaea TaxID=158383 RepID=A0A8S0R5Z6_OLEEU|nr:Hypothetical predicted protein [Olea europaea subsp. europaea]